MFTLWLLGCDPEPDDTAGTAQPELNFDEVVDVVVIGAGVAGLTAAIEADAAGATVVLLERSERVGGAANDAGGSMMFSGSGLQTEVGIQDSPELLAAEWPDLTGGDPDDPWFQLFAEENVPMVYDWLVGLGVAFEGVHDDHADGVTPRTHLIAGGGPAMVRKLEERLWYGALRTESTVDSLIVWEGRVVGVAWHDAAGDYRLGADAVVVATGGFLRDDARMAELFPELANVPLARGSWEGADGAMLTHLESLGAATQNLEAVGFYAHALRSPADPEGEVLSAVVEQSPWLNTLGERFVDESQVNSFEVGYARFQSPGGHVWVVTDSEMEGARFFDPTGTNFVFRDLYEAGLVVEADDLAGLAAALGLPAEAVSAEVERWNSSVSGESEDPFRSPDAEPGAPVESAPFYAAEVMSTPAKCFGGVDVNVAGAVLDLAGAPMPGLYAAGELTGMAGGSLVGDWGFTGSLTAVVLSGRVAGQSAADEALAR